MVQAGRHLTTSQETYRSFVPTEIARVPAGMLHKIKYSEVMPSTLLSYMSCDLFDIPLSHKQIEKRNGRIPNNAI